MDALLLEVMGRKGSERHLPAATQPVQISQTCGLGGVKEREATEIPEVAATMSPVLQFCDLEMMSRNHSSELPRESLQWCTDKGQRGLAPFIRVQVPNSSL